MNKILNNFNCKYEEITNVGSNNNVNVIDGLQCDENEIEISDCRFEYNLLISSFTCNSIKFKNCSFNSIVDIRSTISEISFVDCTFNKNLLFYKVNGNVRFDRSNAETILYENSEINLLALSKCKCKELLFLNTQIDEFKLINTTIKNINMQKSSEAVKVAMKNSNVDILVLKTFKDLEYLNSNLKELELETIDIRDFKRIFKKAKKIDIIRGYKLLISIHKSFSSRNFYSEMDKCLLLLRDFECMSKIYSSEAHALTKFIYYIRYFVIGKMFGWGIKISNNIFTSLAVILAYACIYTPTLKSLKEGSLIDNFGLALDISVNRFLDIGDNQYTYRLLSYVDTQERIIGIVFLTIVTGVIVRKIIK